MDRQRYFVKEDFDSAEGAFLPRGTYVWLLSMTEEGDATVEFQKREVLIPGHMICPSPVPAPPMEKLMEKDPCFARGVERFDLVYKSDDLLFAFYRCKEHGAWFLEDVRGGIGLYSRFIYLADPPGQTDIEYEKVWRSFHQRADDDLTLLGIMGPMPT